MRFHALNVVCNRELNCEVVEVKSCEKLTTETTFTILKQTNQYMKQSPNLTTLILNIH